MKTTTIYTIFLIIILFFARNIMVYFGIPFFHVYRIYIIIALLLIMFNKECLARKNKKLGFLILTVLVIGIIKWKVDGSGTGSWTTVLRFISAPILFGCFPTFSSKPKFWKNAYKILIALFIAECGLSIFERIIHNNIFPWQSDDTDSMLLGAFDDISEFRSFGLFGHPLQNALPVCTMMGFLLCFTKMKGLNKVLLWIMGYLSILCYNTRSSIVGAALILIVYVLKEYFTNKRLSFGKKNLIIISMFIGAIALIGIIIKYNLGARLLEMGLFDQTSAQVRFDAWNIFDYFDISSFLLGRTQDQVEMILYQSGLIVTENFWIDYMLSIGLIALIIISLVYFIVIKELYVGFKTFDVLITLASFILIASTNNSLYDSWVPMFIYLMNICTFSYKENLVNQNLK